MGQAKNRGSLEQRKGVAIEKQLSLRPKYITCNHCQTELSEMFPMDTSKMPGVEAAFAAHCGNCDHDTYALKGEAEAVANAHMAIEDSAGSFSKKGAVPSANGK